MRYFNTDTVCLHSIDTPGIFKQDLYGIIFLSKLFYCISINFGCFTMPLHVNTWQTTFNQSPGKSQCIQKRPKLVIYYCFIQCPQSCFFTDIPQYSIIIIGTSRQFWQWDLMKINLLIIYWKWLVKIHADIFRTTISSVG